MVTEESPIKTLGKLLNSLPDPRVQGRTVYNLSEILFLVISAVLSGAENWEEIQDFGEQKLEWLRQYLPFKQGTPSHDTLNRVMSLIDCRAFEHLFFEWVSQIFVLPVGASIHLDGKSLANSANKADQQKSRANGGKYALQVVNAWCSEVSLCLYQHFTGDKKNEPAAVLSILEMLSVEGCWITADANNCRRPIAKSIVDKKANYILALKGNNPTIHQAVQAAFLQNPEVAQEQRAQELDKNHGRAEHRICELLPATCIDQQIAESWPGLTTLIQITSWRWIMAKDKQEQEVRYYISNATTTATFFNQKIRSHWKVENQLHWVLDVYFAEDASRKRVNNSGQNFAIIRKMALNLLRNHPEKISIKRKLGKCARSDQYRENILFF